VRGAMIRLMRSRRFWIIAFMITGLWFFMGKLLMELEWRDIDLASISVAGDRQDIASGRTGPRLKSDPCMMHQTTIDLDIRLDGLFRLRAGVSDEMMAEVAVARLAAICDGHF
jgi:hypothetical protein